MTDKESMKIIHEIAAELNLNEFSKPRAMIGFKAMVATTNSDQEESSFTDENITEMLHIAPSQMQITMGFDHLLLVGKVESIKKEQGKVIITGKINPGLDGLFVVPAGSIKKEGSINKVFISEFGCTSTPSDKSLTPIEYI